MKSTIRQCAQEIRREEGRPRFHLSADDCRTADCDAGLCQNRAIHSVVFGAFSGDALRDRMNDCASSVLVCSDGYYRQRQDDKQQRQCGRSAEILPHDKEGRGRETRRNSNQNGTGTDLWYHDLMNDPDCPGIVSRKNVTLKTLIHPLHQRQHRQTERCAAYSGRLSALHCVNFQIRYGL